MAYFRSPPPAQVMLPAPEVHGTFRASLGVGSPSTLGCTSVDGKTVRWHLFTDREVGIASAFDHLQVALIGLPGARLARSTKVPQVPWMGILARGGPSYASTAVVWDRRQLPELREVAAVGSDRRLWVAHRDASGVAWHICTLYLPPQPKSGSDEAWHVELEGLREDVREISGASPGMPLTIPVVLMGDINMQPAALGGDREPARARDRRWAAFLEDWGLVHLNPQVGQGPRTEVWLPRRGRAVSLRPGDTHHGGTPRCIDVVVASPPAVGPVIVHNGLHCSSEEPCRWPECVDYTLGDHFFMEAHVPFAVHSGRRVGGALRMPRWWLEGPAWVAGLTAAEPALRRLECILRSVCAGQGRGRYGAKLHRAAGQWLCDALAWLLHVILALAMSGWVVPADAGSRRRRKAAGGAAAQRPLGNRIRESLEKGGAPAAKVARCLHVLEPPAVQPAPCLQAEGGVLSPADSLNAWCTQIRDQSRWPGEWDAQRHSAVQSRVRTLAGRSWAHRGQGELDGPIVQNEVRGVLAGWPTTDATTPDLVPRLVLQLLWAPLDTVVWLLLLVTGPSFLAMRPRGWRSLCAVPLHKAGPPELGESFRLIMVKSQFGLLQESILCQRGKAKVQLSVLPGQSGYVRDVGDAHLLLHELASQAVFQGRALWAVSGDLQKAFPRVWREGLLHRVFTHVGLRDGYFALLCSVLEEDMVHVNINGVAVVSIVQGIAEGGTVGPRFFPCYMDGLSRELGAAGLGVGLGLKMPGEWQGREWKCTGLPRDDLVDSLQRAIREGRGLPSDEELRANQDLEASALLAMDRVAPARLAAVLHADDPVLLGSSRGAAQAAVEVLARWSYADKASPHTKASKHAVLVSGAPGAREAALRARPLELRLRGAEPVQLGVVHVHKWLGLPWRADLDLGAMCRARLAAATAQVASLAGQVASGDVPLAAAASIFEMKIEGALRFGRWLWIVADGCSEAADEAYRSWARAFLGAPPWRSSTVAEAELGWVLSGAGRGVLDVARRRAGLWALPADDLYRRVFQTAHAVPGLSWAQQSAKLLADWGVADWPLWSQAHPGRQREAYVTAVQRQLEHQCAGAWRLRARAHDRPVPLLSLCEGPVRDLASALRGEYSWEVLQGMRSLSRWRAGIFVLGHAGGSRSWAAVQSCVLCGARHRSLTFHACSSCPATAEGRAAFWAARAQPQPGSQEACARALLSARPGEAGYSEAVSLAASVDRLQRRFWIGRG